jgi:hypothetical protein
MVAGARAVVVDVVVTVLVWIVVTVSEVVAVVFEVKVAVVVTVSIDVVNEVNTPPDTVLVKVIVVPGGANAIPLWLVVVVTV